jgi:hypothetical protein
MAISLRYNWSHNCCTWWLNSPPVTASNGESNGDYERYRKNVENHMSTRGFAWAGK